METAYKKITPADVYLSIFDREATEEELWTGRIANCYGNRASGCSFIDIFAGIVRNRGHIPITEYARLMNVAHGGLAETVQMLTGMTARQWRDEYLRMACCELLENSDLSVSEISRRMGFRRVSIFTRFFYTVQKFQPVEWRAYKATGKRKRYHYD